ncbi:hypothetical protein WJX74_010083 [Apatococcus lobatus]|uniref:protein disulfide-isomerase n=1 Tax=Apatococcus lobatus TaxID=904363 RepID=A0AAW1QLM1_9CHLO
MNEWVWEKIEELRPVALAPDRRSSRCLRPDARNLRQARDGCKGRSSGILRPLVWTLQEPDTRVEEAGRGCELRCSPQNRVVIAKVNADEHKSLGTRFGVGGFPTLKYFSRGQPVDEPSDYSGGRTKDAFLEFINKKLTEDSGFARVEVLDALAAKFTSASDTQDLIKQAQELAASLTDDAKINGDVYLKSMQKAASKVSLLLPSIAGLHAP